MSEQTILQQKYKVSVRETPDGAGAIIFTFAPTRLSQEPVPGGAPQRARQFIVAALPETSALEWSKASDDPGAAREEIEQEVAARMKDRAIWIDRVNALVNQIEQWAKEMDWSTRRVVKKLDDARVGDHRVPALLMQEDTCRILLEPVGRSAPGVEGVVDLYLMPAYDDIATLYYYGDRWNLHYLFHGDKPVATVREATALPLSKKTFGDVLAEMRQNAA